ncbi:hydrogenase small subunit [Magnetococcales bacterium HHB-1]
MSTLSRRSFLKLSTLLATSMGLGTAAIPNLAQALETLSLGKFPIIWLQGLACSGCSVSFLNSDEPGPAEVLTRYISLLFHTTISTASGHGAMDIVYGAMEKEGYFLVVEGALPSGMESACVMGGVPMTKLVLDVAEKAKAVITVGTCASFGGIPAAENNPTGAVSAADYLEAFDVSTPIIRLPGCPVHPDWLVGTIAHLVGFGMPELDDKNRPHMFYNRTIHDQCPRFADYERENFAKEFGEPGCLFKLGCVGPNVLADCPHRLWNSRTNFCIRAGAPCVGCASEDFVQQANFPLYRHENQRTIR